MLRKYLIDLEFSLKLLSFKVPGFRDLDHNTRMNLKYQGDRSLPDPVHTGELLPDTHDTDKM